MQELIESIKFLCVIEYQRNNTTPNSVEKTYEKHENIFFQNVLIDLNKNFQVYIYL